jgi:predicted DNA-binding transcriptional regulator YafY
MHALEAQFPDTESAFGKDGHKRWRLQTGALRDLLTLTPDELAALDLSIKLLERNAQGVGATELRRLREKILALVPRSKIPRVETDHEALLEAQCLTPHAFGYDGFRWHTRAFCHTDRKFKDFLLPRILESRATVDYGEAPRANSGPSGHIIALR